MRVSRRVGAASLLLGLCGMFAAAQDPKPAQAPEAVRPAVEAIDDEALLVRIEQACEALRKDGSLRRSRDLLGKAAAEPFVVAETPLVATARTTVLLRRALAQSVVSVGEYYRCDECAAWHANLATGFAVASDGLVATCLHVLEGAPLEDDEESPFLFVAALQGRVFPITELVARDARFDLAVVRCDAKGLAPLPLRGDVDEGERIYCLSHPDHMFASFSEGLVARRYIVRGPAPGTGAPVDPDAPIDHDVGKTLAAKDGDPRAFLQVTCEFAGGSSGAPIVDAFGNVIGIAQSTATVAVDPEAEALEVQMVARTASPASALRALLRR